jgi:hypothetical protein
VAAPGERDVQFRGANPHVDGQLPDGDTLPSRRLRYGGPAARCRAAIRFADEGRYQDAILPTGGLAGLPGDALVAFQTFVLFITTNVATYLKLPRSYELRAVLIAGAGELFHIAWFGRLPGRFERRPPYLLAAIGAANWVFVFCVLAHTGTFSLMVLGVSIALFFHAAAHGSQAATLVGRFPTSILCGYASKGCQIAGIFGQALAPFICVAILERHDISLLASPNLVVVPAVTTACVLVAAEASRIDQYADLIEQRAGERCRR